MNKRPELIDKDKFCDDFIINNPELSEKLSGIKVSISELYDIMFSQLAGYLINNKSNMQYRVYLPLLGTLYRSPVPANPKCGLPERYRYRLSCKARPVDTSKEE